MTRAFKSALLTEDERAVLQEICDELKVPRDILERMLSAENQVYGMGRRHGIFESLRTLVTEAVENETGEGLTDDSDEN